MLFHEGVCEGGAAEFVGTCEGFEERVEDERGGVARAVGVN